MDFYPRPPRGGRHASASSTSTAPQNFYPRPPRGGRRENIRGNSYVAQFLSTPSARRATDSRSDHDSIVRNFYPRPPRGGRPVSEEMDERSEQISIHALREEGDLFAAVEWGKSQISIHALREEGDQLVIYCFQTIKDFYPRPPRGGRRGLL